MHVVFHQVLRKTLSRWKFRSTATQVAAKDVERKKARAAAAKAELARKEAALKEKYVMSDVMEVSQLSPHSNTTCELSCMTCQI